MDTGVFYLRKETSEAEDACQQAFLKLWHHQDAIAPDKINGQLLLGQA